MKHHDPRHSHNSRKTRKIVKSTGELEWFSAQKLKRSLERTGLIPKYCSDIAKEVAVKVKAGDRTKDIFKQTMKLVEKKSPVAAVHYSLKKSILELGPAGFTFEHYVAKYFETIGFNTYVGVVLQGQFVRHEVDVVASKKNYQLYAECKFHNASGKKNDVKIPLYVKARWDDLKNGPDGQNLKGYYLVSNTAFTKDAIEYSKGCGLHLLGINAPEEESFLEKIKKLKLYPITSLKRLKKMYVQELLQKKIILCSELQMNPKILFKLGMTHAEVEIVLNDINKLLNEK